jgi:hypothetical protein
MKRRLPGTGMKRRLTDRKRRLTGRKRILAGTKIRLTVMQV